RASALAAEFWDADRVASVFFSTARFVLISWHCNAAYASVGIAVGAIASGRFAQPASVATTAITVMTCFISVPPVTKPAQTSSYWLQRQPRMYARDRCGILALLATNPVVVTVQTINVPPNDADRAADV